MARRVRIITYVAAYLFALGVALRYVLTFSGDDLRSIVPLLAFYMVLLIAEPFLIRQHRRLSYLYLILQVAIISAISFTIPTVDFWAGLFFPLLVQVMNNYPSRAGYRITGAFTVIMALLMLLGLGVEAGLPIAITNAVAFFLIAAFTNLLGEAEAARQEAVAAREASQRQQAELQSAHRQLLSYTAQAEELAVLQERNRLARNLHDSVTQTIFSMRLTAEAANMLMDRNPERVRPELDKLQALAKSALAEMRSMIFELRPTAVTELGLIPALRHHIITLERQFGLTVDLQVSGEPHVSELEAQRLFRISQEALNNVVKHAHTDKACLTLRFDGDHVFLQVKDQGIGFEPHALSAAEDHMGLVGLQERVDALGGLLSIDSQPGQGTRVTVEVTSTNVDENDG